MSSDPGILTGTEWRRPRIFRLSMPFMNYKGLDLAKQDLKLGTLLGGYTMGVRRSSVTG